MGVSSQQYMRAAAAAGTALLSVRRSGGQTKSAVRSSDDLNIALIGAGEQGRKALIVSCLKIPGVRFKAICDIWPSNLDHAVNTVKKYQHDAKGYADYREMLAGEKDLDAVLVATPDWMHAEHANACMNAGLHVYCEKEMSNSLEKARSMVRTAKATGKLLQIGHQRRSNPRYVHAIDRLIRQERLLGRVTHGYAQWNRSKSASADIGGPKEKVLDAATLEKYGYASMHEFRNWRWFRKFGGGPIVDLGSHQIDLFSWVWGVNPRSVIASGGNDFYKSREWYDNVMTVYEFETKEGIARAFYQVLTTTQRGGFYETFMGEDGTLVISEVSDRGNVVERESHAPDWDKLAKRGYLTAVEQPAVQTGTRNIMLDVRATAQGGRWVLPVELSKKEHQPHLENFFDAIRSGVSLNCPGEVGYETAVAVLAANEAVASGRRVEFKPGDFTV